MKYTEAWASVVSQNLNLKVVTAFLTVISIILGMINLRLSFKDAIVIERGCSSRSIQPVKDEHSKTEIEFFVKEALAQRFDSSVTPTDGLLSIDELKLREQEQKDFSSRSIKQKIVINSVTEMPDGFKIDSDRVISVGEVRSAFKFPLLVKLESKARTQSNPYGLLITSTKQFEEKQGSKTSETK